MLPAAFKKASYEDLNSLTDEIRSPFQSGRNETNSFNVVPY